jgi:hypothetical protein
VAQHDYNIANAAGAAVRADMNAALAAILTSNSGATAPTVTAPFMPWFDTSAGVFRIRNQADTAWVLWPVALGIETGDTGTLSVPAGTTAERDTSLGRGIRYNTTLGQWEGWDGSAWGSISGAGARSPIAPITFSPNTPSAGALTISCSQITMDFRNPTTGVVTTATGTPASLVISSGSTLGTASGILARIAVGVVLNAGVMELTVNNLAGSVNLSESVLVSTTAEGGAGAADSATVIYSATARTSVPYRNLCFFESTQTTAGTWTAAPSLVTGSAEPLAMWFGGYGQNWQTVAGAAFNTDYTNTSGRRRDMTAIVLLTAGNAAVLRINGVDRFLSQNNGSGGVNFSFSASLNPGDVYRLNNSAGGTLNTWSENR